MKEKQFNKILKLISRTGDRFVVLDRDTDKAMAIMDLDEYEQLLTEAGELDAESDSDFDEDFDVAEDLNWDNINEPAPEVENFFTPVEEEKKIPIPTDKKVGDWAPIGKIISGEKIKTTTPVLVDEAENNPVEIPVQLHNDIGPEFLPEPEADFDQPILKEEKLDDVQEEEEEKFYLEPV